jgi:MFS family permease
MLRAFIGNWPLFFSIWYLYETQFASIATLSLIYSVSQLVPIILEVPTGYFADRWGRKTSSIIGYILQAAAWFILGSATSIYSLWLGYLVYSAGMAFVSGAISALDYDTLKQDGRAAEFSKWMNIANVIGNATIFVSIIVGGYIANYSYRWTYWGTGWSMTVVVLLMLFVREPEIGGKLTAPIRETLQDFGRAVRGVFLYSETRALLIYYTLFSGLSYAFIFVFSLVYATPVYPDSVFRGYILAGISLGVAVLLGIFSGYLVKRPKFTLVVWGTIASIGYIGGGIASLVYLAPLWMLLLYFAYNLRLAVVDQFINDAFPSKFRATLLSVLNLGASLIAFLALALGGRGVELFGITNVFLGIGVLCIVGVTMYGVSVVKKV